MRLFTKIFLCTVLVITISMAILGYSLISTSFNNAVANEKSRITNEFSLLEYTFKAGIFNAKSTGHRITKTQLNALCIQTVKLTTQNCHIALFDSNDDMVYSDFPLYYDFSLLDSIAEEDTVYIKIDDTDDDFRVCAASRFSQSGTSVTLIKSESIKSVITDRNQMCIAFIKMYLIIVLSTSAIMLILAFLITRPINKLTAATKIISAGSFDERVAINSTDEIGALAKSFNSMAEQIEEKINELEDTARQKEEFTMSLTHELKTPLTSIIGYADMILTRSLTSDEIFTSAEFIMNEGMRLEALSLKLMDLIILEKQSFTLIEVSFSDCIADLDSTCRPLYEKKAVSMKYDIDDSYVKIEPDLFKTLLINIIDNSIKYGAKNILLSGKCTDDGFKISVKDDGCGIPEVELSKIQEAFYMVDKSRSRKLHSAGLGLAICARIAAIHGTQLEFKSKEGTGTTVSLILPCDCLQNTKSTAKAHNNTKNKRKKK